MSRPTTVRLGDDEYRTLEELAHRRGTTVSGLIQDAVRAHYLRGDPVMGTEALLRFVEDHPHPVEGTVEDIEARIDEAMGDAAGR